MEPSSSHLMNTATHLEPESHDPHEINAYATVVFGDVIGEPRTAMTTEWVWRNTQKTFTMSKDICYLILSVVFGLPAAVLWGVNFALISFETVWCVTPISRMVRLLIHSVQSSYQTAVKCLCDPVFEAIGLIFSNVKVVVNK